MNMKKKKGKAKPPNNGEHEPYRVRIPGFISDEEVGLGDVIKRVTHAIGIKPCGSCGRRAAVLNRLMIFSGPRAR
jgi:hypothetical protein